MKKQIKKLIAANFEGAEWFENRTIDKVISVKRIKKAGKMPVIQVKFLDSYGFPVTYYVSIYRNDLKI